MSDPRNSSEPIWVTASLINRVICVTVSSILGVLALLFSVLVSYSLMRMHARGVRKIVQPQVKMEILMCLLVLFVLRVRPLPDLCWHAFSRRWHAWVLGVREMILMSSWCTSGASDLDFLPCSFWRQETSCRVRFQTCQIVQTTGMIDEVTHNTHRRTCLHNTRGTHIPHKRVTWHSTAGTRTCTRIFARTHNTRAQQPCTHAHTHPHTHTYTRTHVHACI